MINELTNKNGEFLISFEDFNGSGWSSDVENIIRVKIIPDKIVKRLVEASWHYSEIEFDVKKRTYPLSFI